MDPISYDKISMQDFQWIIPVVSMVGSGLVGWWTAGFKVGRYAQMVDDLKCSMAELKKDHDGLTKEVTICQTKVEGLQDDVRFNVFKDFVYQKGVGLETIFIVMGIYLRDIALAVLGFRPEELDQTQGN